MATTYTDPASGWKAFALQARTDESGVALDDTDGEDLRSLIEALFSDGVLAASAYQVAEDSGGASMNVEVGSGSAKTDLAVLAGTVAGQGSYLVRLEDGTVTVSVPAADLTNPRIDELYLVVQDDPYDSNGTNVVPRLAYRDGTPASSPSAPGPDASWKAYLKLATIDVAASVSSIGNADITDERSTAVLIPGLSAGTVGTLQLVDDAVTLAKVADNAVGTLQLVDDAVTAAKVGVIQSAYEALAAVSQTAEFENGSGGSGGSTSFVDVLSTSLTIPADWNTYNVFVWFNYETHTGTAASNDSGQRVVVGASNGTERTDFIEGSAEQTRSLIDYFSGLSTTGSVTVKVQTREISGSSTKRFESMTLIARAVRTS